MKIRKGFVSNSSSSSFVIVGIKYEGTDALLEIVEKKDGFVEKCNNFLMMYKDVWYEDQSPIENLHDASVFAKMVCDGDMMYEFVEDVIRPCFKEDVVFDFERDIFYIGYGGVYNEMEMFDLDINMPIADAFKIADMIGVSQEELGFYAGTIRT